jgi:hypothetical protein
MSKATTSTIDRENRRHFVGPATLRREINGKQWPDLDAWGKILDADP